MDIKIDITEARYIFQEALSNKRQKSAVTSAKKAGASVIRKAAYKTKRFQDYSGTARDLHNPKRSRANNLRASLKTNKIGLKVTKWNKNVFVVAGYGGIAPHAHLVEFGHNSSKNGPVEGRYFMEAAARENINEALKAAEKAFVKNIERQLNKSIR